FPNSAVTHLASGHRCQNLCFFLCGPAWLRVRSTPLLPPAPSVPQCHKEGGQFCTHRGKPVGSLGPPPIVKLLEKRIPADCFVIHFFPFHMYPVGRQTVSHLENSDK
ncbi:PREDICTED: uncharacterized protein C12orf79 homolog, partial [Galeopterus variegatus]|uniref:Uncharacterized protein C12orf79 homolog n=1 Tax=Galeopterus variegatus TaxID=482537 RepID=A0ABM0SF75_GALVR